jgi:cobalt-zinc-cadmium efflux system membrane fusion protein
MKKSLYILFISSLLFACSKNETKQNNTSNKPVLNDSMLATIETYPAIKEHVTGTLKLTGKVTPDNNKVVEVFPLVSGNVKEVSVELGDYVKKGQVLAKIHSGEIAEIQRELIDAKSNVQLREKQYSVAKDLYNAKLNSETDVIAANKQLEEAKSELRKIQEVASILKVNKSSEYSVIAPISGFIIDKKINIDMQLRNDRAENLFTIADINDIWITANVYEVDIAKVKEGLHARISPISYPEKSFQGKVDKIFNVLDPTSKTMQARIVLHNADFSLKPEMNTMVELQYFEDKQLVAIPSSAIIFNSNKNYVLVFHDKKNIEIREVDVYKNTNGKTYLLGGLEGGENIILKNQLYIFETLNN